MWLATGPRYVRNYCSSLSAWFKSNYKSVHRKITLFWSFSIPNKLFLLSCLCSIPEVCIFAWIFTNYMDIVKPEIVSLPAQVIRNIKVKFAAHFYQNSIEFYNMILSLISCYFFSLIFLLALIFFCLNCSSYFSFYIFRNLHKIIFRIRCYIQYILYITHFNTSNYNVTDKSHQS